MQILVVDDDDEIRASLRRGLGLEGYSVVAVASAEEALGALGRGVPELVVLDILLPDMDGVEVCRRIRLADAAIPIIMLTARDAVEDRVFGLESGADDYLVKPFAFEELLARIRVRTRQRGERSVETLRFGDLTLDLSSREATRGSRAIALTTTEYQLLKLFLQNPRRVLTRDVIYERVWGYDFDGESKIIEVYVRYLREKLERTGETRLIHTVRGAGYVLRENR